MKVRIPAEVESVTHENLEAATDMYDNLIDGTHYQKQEASGFPIKYLPERGSNESKS